MAIAIVEPTSITVEITMAKANGLERKEGEGSTMMSPGRARGVYEVSTWQRVITSVVPEEFEFGVSVIAGVQVSVSEELVWVRFPEPRSGSPLTWK